MREVRGRPGDGIAVGRHRGRPDHDRADRAHPFGQGHLALLSYTVLTTAAEPGLAHPHDRMPVVIDPADFDRWLDPRVGDPARVADLLTPPPRRLIAEPSEQPAPAPTPGSDATLF